MDPRFRVLILSVSAGTGHVRAAEALEKVCRARQEIADVVNVDALRFTNKVFRDCYSKLYIDLVRNAPTFLGWWYQKSDEPWKTDRMRLMFDRMNTGPLVRMVRKVQPDMTICTHFLPAEIISHLISRGDIEARLSIVVTDLDFHAMWLSRLFHHYFVALDETKEHLKLLGLPEDRVTVSGIPVDPVFAEKKDRVALAAKLGLDPAKPMVLLSAGAFGVGPAAEAVQVLKHLKTPAQVVVICGRNDELLAEARRQAVEVPAHLQFHLLGFTDIMDEWMTVADVLIGKPGGLTTAEALCKGLPMVILSPIPGQEERNSDHLLEEGVAIRCNDIITMGYKIDRLLQTPGRLASMRQAALGMSRPFAAETVVTTLLEQFRRLPHKVEMVKA